MIDDKIEMSFDYRNIDPVSVLRQAIMRANELGIIKKRIVGKIVFEQKFGEGLVISFKVENI